MKKRDLYLAAYDISDPRLRRGARDILKAFSIGGQKSVYECFLTPAEQRLLLDQLALFVKPHDRFFALRLDPRCRVIALGRAKQPKDEPFFYIG